jgi:hypothetical protein
MKKPILNEKFSDNGEHSHWELIDANTGEVLWGKIDAVLPQADVMQQSEQLKCLDCGMPYEKDKDGNCANCKRWEL